MKWHIEDIVYHAQEIRQGAWWAGSGGGSDYLFFRRGTEVVITKVDGEWVTLLPEGSINKRFLAADVIP